MLVAATGLLEKIPAPHENEVMDAIGGVLCRCTGYRKIIAAILDAGVKESGSADGAAVSPGAGAAVGKRLVRLDGRQKVDGSELFGADETPVSALAVRAIRSPYHRSRFHFGDLAAFVRDHPGIEAVFTAKDVPGKNCYGVISKFADQPVFAEGEARHRGEAIAAVVGETAAVEALEVGGIPGSLGEMPPLSGIYAPPAAGRKPVPAKPPAELFMGGGG